MQELDGTGGRPKPVGRFVTSQVATSLFGVGGMGVSMSFAHAVPPKRPDVRAWALLFAHSSPRRRAGGPPSHARPRWHQGCLSAGSASVRGYLILPPAKEDMARGPSDPRG